MKYLFPFCTLFFVCLSVFSQNTTTELQIQGNVINQVTGEPIPYCNITVASSFFGSASNEMGEFILNVNAFPVTLVFSHINYEKTTLEIFEASDVTIELTPLTNILEEVVLIDTKKDPYATQLARKAFKKADQNANTRKYGRAFYRQKSKNDAAYSEFSEIIYDLHYTARGIGDWEILEGRYALKQGGVHNKNYTLLSRLLTPLQPATDELVFPLRSDFESYYSVRVVEHIASGDDKIAVLWFKPKKNLELPIFEAEVYVDTKSHDILKIAGNITHDNLKLVKLTEKGSSWKEYTISYEIAYRQHAVLNSVIDYIKIDQEFDYYKNDSLALHAASTSNLTFFEHYVPTSRKKLGGQFRKNQSDWQKLDEIGYNEKFWEDNPIVKRTPVEKEVIAAFEKDKAFGTIFLNSRNQIAVMQSDLADEQFIQEIDENVRLYNNYNPTEKVYLHADKDLFSAGEDLWYSGYVVLGPFHHFSTGSKVLHVDLIDGNNQIVLSQTNEIIEGKSYGSLRIPDDLAAGNYQLRSYTNWMRNFDSDFFFTRTIKVLNEQKKQQITANNSSKIDLQFFPEGGYLVDGIIGVVAFKAIGNDGKEKKIQGRIVDSQGKFISNLGAIDRGAGYFSFKPSASEHYTAILKDGSNYALPKTIDKGYGITVNNISPKSIQVKVQATPLLRKQHFYLLAHQNNKKYYQGKFEFDGKPTVSFEIPKNGIPSGVMTLTLFDQAKKPWCERIVFVNNQDELVISTDIAESKIEKRGEVAIDVHVTDTYGRPVSGEFSVAITDKGQIDKNEGSGNILTNLLLQSDIKGTISKPALLFKSQRRATLHQLDLIMLTHGWRKFPWLDIQENANLPKVFAFSKGLAISGLAQKLNKKPLTNTALNVVAKSEEQIEMFSTTTSHEGRFLISNFNFRDSTEIAVNAFNNGNTPIDVFVKLDTNQTRLPTPNFEITAGEAPSEAVKKYATFSTTRKNMSLIHDFKNATELEEVVIMQKKGETINRTSVSTLGQTPDATLFTKNTTETGVSLLDYVRRFVGVTVTGNFPGYTVSIRQLGTPLWVLNGVPISKGDPQGIGIEASLNAAPVPPQIALMDISDVERVELLKGPSAAIWGSRGANGVFLVYTKRGGGKTIYPAKSPSFTIFGHAAQKEFYSPKYDVPLEEHNVPDYRATLYWNPGFTTDKNGNAKLIFYNSDNAKQLQIAIEGLSDYGTPGAYLRTFGE